MSAAESTVLWHTHDEKSLHQAFDHDKDLCETSHNPKVGGGSGVTWTLAELMG
jgi:hypothetical protein